MTTLTKQEQLSDSSFPSFESFMQGFDKGSMFTSQSVDSLINPEFQGFIETAALQLCKKLLSRWGA